MDIVWVLIESSNDYIEYIVTISSTNTYSKRTHHMNVDSFEVKNYRAQHCVCINSMRIINSCHMYREAAPFECIIALILIKHKYER